MKIQFIKKNVYGKEMMYIKSPVALSAVSRLTGKKTIDQLDIYALQALGCELEQVID